MRTMRISVAFLTAAMLVGVVSVARAADPGAVAPPPAPAIPGNRAGDYVGQDVTVEGRVTAIHESPLATVLAFSQNFAGFTATILAADRDKFPRDLDARIRDHVVRVTGTVTTYRGKPEMALRDPAQLVLAPPPGPGSVAAAPLASAPAASPDRSSEELRRALGRIETRLEAIEGRLTTIEQGSADAGEPAAAPAR
jgi:hypothetical protein